MPVLIHTGLQRRKSLCDFPLRLLARGSAPQAPLNTEFHSVRGLCLIAQPLVIALSVKFRILYNGQSILNTDGVT